MSKFATPVRKPGFHLAFAVTCSIAATGCVSSTIDTSGSFTNNTINASEVLSLTADDTLPQPSTRPGSETLAVASSTPVTAPATGTVVPATDLQASLQPTPPAPVATDVALASAPLTTPPTAIAPDLATSRIASAQNAPVAGGEAAPVQVAAAQPTPVVAREQPRTGFLNSLFGNRKPQPRAAVPSAPAVTQVASVTAAPAPKANKPVVIAKAAAEPKRPQVVIATASSRGSTAGLPGVDRERVLGIAQTDDADDEEGGGIQVASAAGLARLAPNGLRTQTAGVDVACLKPALVRTLKNIERKYGKPVVVTSGYRSPSRNARARGAKNSLHMYCAAADIQVEGVSKWDLAKYLRTVPGRGGVGTYCHTNSVHVDIGPARDWNWRCKRKS